MKRDSFFDLDFIFILIVNRLLLFRPVIFHTYMHIKYKKKGTKQYISTCTMSYPHHHRNNNDQRRQEQQHSSGTSTPTGSSKGQTDFPEAQRPAQPIIPVAYAPSPHIRFQDSTLRTSHGQVQPQPPTASSSSSTHRDHRYGLSSSYNDPIATTTTTRTRQRFTRSSPIAIQRNKTSGDDAGGRGGVVDTSSDEEGDDDNHRNGLDEGDDDDDDDDDEYDNGIVDVERDAVRLGLRKKNTSGVTARSLPSRLLKAPLLGSVPTNEDYLSYRSIPATALPPPMTLNDPSLPSSSSLLLSGMVSPDGTSTGARGGATASYGSLRESNLRGRFFDGPSSYRDGRTGDIRRVGQRVVRFHELQQQATSASSSSTTTEGDGTNRLSIRDRMKQAREQRNRGNNDDLTKRTDQPTNNKKPTSSLAAMFDDNTNRVGVDSSSSATTAATAAADKGGGGGGDDNPKIEYSATTAFRPASFHDSTSPFYETNHHMGAVPSGALSTSLTGLEILQRGLRLATITDHDSHQSNGEEMSHSRSGNGGPAAAAAAPPPPPPSQMMFSRSFSDPRGARRSVETQQNRGPGVVAPRADQDPNFLPPFALGAGGRRGTSGAATAAQQQQQQQQHFIPPLHLGGSATTATATSSPSLASPVVSHLSAALLQPNDNNSSSSNNNNNNNNTTIENATAAVDSLSLLDDHTRNTTTTNNSGVADPDLEEAFEMDLE